ncbi:SGNH/GDSL hydrolase family protein [Rhodoferax sp. 4810]|nr:SGNH/GDSL hydrolase family protein [Rhodoferax jenense]
MTFSLRKLLLAASLTLLAPLAAHATLQTLNQLFVFGDSLSDGGNYADPINPGGFPPYPYAGTRYSNGLTAVEYLWQAYHPGDTTFKPSNFGGTNYALGGSTTGKFNFNSVNPNVSKASPLLLPWFADQGGVANQVASFASICSNCFVPDESLFVVWAFPNDVFSSAVLGLDAGALITAGVTNIKSTVQTLIDEGATNFLIPNMPDLGSTPGFLGRTDLTGLSMAFNAALAGALTGLDQAMKAVEITQFDTFATLNTIIANKEQYGFTNVTEQCVDNLTNGRCNPNTWLFWDGVHPTTAGHAILGAQFAAAVPEPSALWLMALALVLLAASRQTRQRLLRRSLITVSAPLLAAT